MRALAILNAAGVDELAGLIKGRFKLPTTRSVKVKIEVKAGYVPVNKPFKGVWPKGIPFKLIEEIEIEG